MNYDAPKAGNVEVDYGGASGHTLAIQDPKFDGFLLTTDAGGPKKGKVLLASGKYTIYCTVPGHEAAGMKGTITVP
jgi:plastocyanin